MFTITAEDFPPKVKKFVRPGANSLRTDDIEGAQSYLPGYKFRNKPDFFGVGDIEKASPSSRYRSLNKPEFNLSTQDIPYASPNAVLFKSNRSGHNPLTPVYILPSYEVKPLTPPRFIRDQISVDDIEGSKPQIYSKWQTRNSSDISDIQGATIRDKRVLNKPDFMNPKDINTIEVFLSNRSTNPLMPEYLTRNEDNTLVTIGAVEGSQPRKLVNASQSPHSRHLNTKDIDGATSGTVGVGPIGTKLRNYIRSPTDTLDIEGTQTGTFKKGITTVRTTNPLDPQYTWMTEEPQEEKPAEKPLANDKFYQKNTAKFWGTTPVISSVPSARTSKASTPNNHEYLSNAKRFYGAEATPNTLQQDFKKNADKFYASLGKPTQINYLNPGSIHMAKQPYKNVDFETESYARNAKDFFGAYSRSSRQSEGGEKEARNERESVKSPPSDRASLKSVDSQNYQFQLSRAEIAKPNEAERRGRDDSRGSSQRKSLSAVGKQFISS